MSSISHWQSRGWVFILRGSTTRLTFPLPGKGVQLPCEQPCDFHKKHPGSVAYANDERSSGHPSYRSPPLPENSLTKIECKFRHVLGSRDGTVARVLASHQCGPGSIPAASYVDWACCWLFSLLRVFSSRSSGFSSLLKNQHFQMPIRSGTGRVFQELTTSKDKDGGRRFCERIVNDTQPNKDEESNCLRKQLNDQL